MLEIDGSYGEGGGQILRTSVALSAITEKPIRIFNIRKGRKQPGLKAQHLTGILAAKELCGAKVRGAKISSTELVFEPGKIRHGQFKFDVGTAGAITLVLQTLVPIAAFSKDACAFEISGGTDVGWSPTVDYFQHIYCDYMKQIGLEIKIKILKRGFYPKGGGKVHVSVLPWKERKPYNYTNPGKFRHVDVWSVATKDLEKAQVVERQIRGFQKEFGPEIRKKNKIYVDALSTGTSFHAHAHFEHAKLGVCVLGEKGKPAEKVGQEAAVLLKREIESSATADRWMADQLVPFLAFCGGKFRTSKITQHLRTNVWVVEKFGAKFQINEKRKEVSAIKFVEGVA